MSQRRDTLLNGSLAASALGSERISRWFGSSEPRKRPCSMQFHKIWQDPECEVMKWYQLQTQSSTQLASIQHWRNLDEPFFHEYLMIQLVDGSMCRLERLGDGSRPEAVLQAGCEAHDIIQWFTAEDRMLISSSRPPAELITEIRFQVSDRPDLLDVLAICYSIQHIRPTSVYTLQRFNCYFLCITVLAVFSRYLCIRQTPVTSETHSRIVNAMMDKLRTMGHGNASEYLAFGFCSLLSPEQQNPKHFIYDSLQGILEAWSRDVLGSVLAGAVWESSQMSSMKKSLPNYVRRAVDIALAGENMSATVLENLRQGDGKNCPDGIWELATQPDIARYLRRKLYESAREASKAAYGSYYQSHLVNDINKPSKFQRILTTIFGATLPPSLSSTFSLLSTTAPAVSAWIDLYKNSQDDVLARFGVGLGDLR
ncbi:unnamed protein product [Rhizoctonia solani]|nr:unnamed protein product [Rhizoctonia solani]